MKIQILIDNQSSWIIPFAKQYVKEKSANGLNVELMHEHNLIDSGDILCLLSCEKKFKSLHLNKHNLVVHESDLPKGRGMSPMTWQIVEGNNSIVVSLLEATDEIDSGVIYAKETIELKGHELVEEWRRLQAEATFKLLNQFIQNYPNNKAQEQDGTPTYYPKRTKTDSKLDVHLPIADQFNLLRVVDNERYPAWFELNGYTYEIKIYKKNNP